MCEFKFKNNVASFCRRAPTMDEADARLLALVKNPDAALQAAEQRGIERVKRAVMDAIESLNAAPPRSVVVTKRARRAPISIRYPAANVRCPVLLRNRQGDVFEQCTLCTDPTKPTNLCTHHDAAFARDALAAESHARDMANADLVARARVRSQEQAGKIITNGGDIRPI
jgi:hypothetical protein